MRSRPGCTRRGEHRVGPGSHGKREGRSGFTEGFSEDWENGLPSKQGVRRCDQRYVASPRSIMLKEEPLPYSTPCRSHDKLVGRQEINTDLL